MVAAKAVVKANPIIGSFNTSGLRSTKEARRETGGIFPFINPYAMVPGLAVGLIALNMPCDTNARVKASTSEITANSFTLHIDSWADTELYGAGSDSSGRLRFPVRNLLHAGGPRLGPVPAPQYAESDLQAVLPDHAKGGSVAL